ncbi:MAG: hypothetical protein H0U34_06995 [Sphingomonas sp.]|nr:hypothetical protein [Sphingomonas sp.]
MLDLLAGRRDAALDALERRSRTKPLKFLQLPAMSLRHVPVFAELAGDRRFELVDERLRAATNAERAKLGLAPIGRDAWVSDPKALLTKICTVRSREL